MNAKQLRKKFEAELKELQRLCPHTKTEILPYTYAPGHFAGSVEVCKRCEKVIVRLE